MPAVASPTSSGSTRARRSSSSTRRSCVRSRCWRRRSRRPSRRTTTATYSRRSSSGRLVVVLGSGVNAGTTSDGGLPAYAEIAAALAESFDYPPEGERDLARVSQYVALMKGVGPLYDELHGLFAREYEPAACAPRRSPSFAARLAGARRAGPADRHRELRPGARAGAHRGRRGVRRRLVHRARPAPRASSCTSPRTARRASSRFRTPTPTSRPEERTVILKIHGGVDPAPDREWDSFVVSEDDYIDYLALFGSRRRRARRPGRPASPQPLPLPRLPATGVVRPRVPAPPVGARHARHTGRGRSSPASIRSSSSRGGASGSTSSTSRSRSTSPSSSGGSRSRCGE